MIRLNLLPHRLTQRDIARASLRRTAYWVLGSTLLASLLVTLALTFALWQQQQRNRYLQSLTATHAVAAQRSQALSTQVADYQARQRQLSDAMAQQAFPWFMLTQLEALLPPNLHLTQLSWQPPYLTLEGLANSHEAIALMLTELSQAPWLSHATLLSSQQQDDAWAFALSAQTEAP